MKYPTIGADRQYRITVPQMDGAVNRVASPSAVEDNQPTDTSNMWWHDGVLCTRPGFQAKKNSVSEALTFQNSVFYGDHEVLCPSPADAPVYGRQFYTQRGSTAQEVQTVGYDGEVRPFRSKDGQSLMGYAHGIAQYVQLIPYGTVEYERGGETYRGDGVIVWDQGQMYGLPESGSEWVSLNKEAYIPLVAAEGKGVSNSDADHLTTFSGTLNEPINLLSRWFRVQFTTGDDIDLFYLPYQNLSTRSDVKVSITYRTGNTEEYVIPMDSDKVKVNDRFYIYVDREKGFIRFDQSDTQEGGSYVPIYTGQTDNLEVTAELADNHTNSHMITRMTTFRWFGGDRSGLNRGTRLFAAANTDPDYSNCIMWSALNNPLYWPENNYARIGDNTQAVTALAQQGNTLIIFKEREIYYSEYVASTLDAEDFVNGSVLDTEVNAAYFPVTPLSADIGCDCPDTICLCNNHLVWVTSRKMAYVLTSRNQYSDSNVQEISANIEPLLSGLSYTDMTGASAGIYDGYYYLLIQNRLYLMDYNDSAYTYVALNGTYKTDTSKIKWYTWDIDHLECTRILGGREGVLLAGVTQLTDSRRVHAYYVMQGDEDTKLREDDEGVVVFDYLPISSYVQTKVLDFDSPEVLKNVLQVYVGLSGKAQSEVSFWYLTEHGEQKDPYQIIKFGEENENRNRYLSEYRLTPNMVRIKCFGMKICGRGAFALSNLILKYKPLGGTR